MTPFSSRDNLRTQPNIRYCPPHVVGSPPPFCAFAAGRLRLRAPDTRFVPHRVSSPATSKDRYFVCTEAYSAVFWDGKEIMRL